MLSVQPSVPRLHPSVTGSSGVADSVVALLFPRVLQRAPTIVTTTTEPMKSLARASKTRDSVCDTARRDVVLDLSNSRW